MIRRKVAERIQARRRAAGSGAGRVASSLPSATAHSAPVAVFCSVTASDDKAKPRAGGRMDSLEGFLVVEDRDGESESSVDELEDHEAICQAMEDDISGFEIEDEEEEGERERKEGGGEGMAGGEESPPRSKPSPTLSGRERAGALSVSRSESREEGGQQESLQSKSSLKPWQMSSDKEIYEQQLVLMQEQLTTAMIEKEELRSELKSLKEKVKTDSRKELQNLVKENRELSKKLELASGTSKGASVGGAKGGASRETVSSEGGTLTVEQADNGFESVSVSPSRGIRARHQRRQAVRKGVVKRIKDKFYDFLSDFTEEVATGEEVKEEPSLAARKLRNNLQRLSRSSKPWLAFGDGVQGVLQWRKLAESLVTFLVYMYCVWNGWIMQVVAFLAIIKLSLNYLQTSGLAEQFGFHTPVVEETPEELGFKDKIQVVKSVAQTCQNRSGQLSDALEKLQNLFMWHYPPATQRLYTMLCGFLVMSLLLPNDWTLTLVGFGIGIKLFIIDNVYRKYPKVKRKYDTVARLWKELPTDAELMKRQALTEEEVRNTRTRRFVTTNSRDSMVTINVADSPSLGAANEDVPDSSPSATSHSVPELSQVEMSFCSRFQVSLEEVPLPWWQAGRRCSLLDKRRPLTLTKSGKLYLTHSLLCFERVGKAARDSERIIISLKMVKEVKKAKPFAVLPGSGMSIDVLLQRGDKFTFSAMLNRDQAYQSILDQGMILGLPWGSDPTGEGGGAGREEEEDEEKGTLSSDEGERSHETTERQEVEVIT